MIKKFLCLVCTLSLASALSAAITVIQDGQQPVEYKKGSVISINGKAKTVVNYDKIVVTVPQGQAVRISSDANGNVLVSGSNLNRILIGGSVVSANGNTVLSINPKTQIVTVKEGGPAYVTTAGRTSTVTKDSSIKIAAIPDEYVNIDYNDNINRYDRNQKKAEQKPAPVTATQPLVQEEVVDPMQAFLSEASKTLDLPDFATRQIIDDVVLESEISPSAPTGN
jgi:outer membrane lipoprotein-sorting protein